MKENEVGQVCSSCVFILHWYMHNKDDNAISHAVDNHYFQLKTDNLHAPIFHLNTLQLQTSGSAIALSKILIFKENTSSWMSFTVTKRA